MKTTFCPFCYFLRNGAKTSMTIQDLFLSFLADCLHAPEIRPFKFRICTYTYKVKIFKRNETNILKGIGKNASDKSFIVQEKIQYQLHDETRLIFVVDSYIY